MAARNFDQCLNLVLAWEGGFSDHPADPGGATNKGVTQRVYDAYRARQRRPARNVQEIEDHELRAIYRKQYWDAVRGDDLPDGLDYATFDYAVNSGPDRASRDLQRVLGVDVDGIVGNITLQAAADADVTAIDDLCARRLAFVKRLKHWPVFGKGWARRISGVNEQALDLAIVGETDAAREASAKRADPADRDDRATKEAVGAGTAGIGTIGMVASEAANSIAPLVDYADALKWVFVALVIVGVAVTAYAKLREADE